VRLSGSSPSPSSGPALGTWNQLSANVAYTWSATGIQVGTLTYTLATDSAGTNVVATGTVSVDLEVTN
jgi:hypothetical protein